MTWLGILCASATLAASAGGPATGDWPQWRGPARDGVAAGFVAPKSWPATLTRVWSVTVGEGHSNPVVSGDRVFLHSREGDKEVVRCLRLSDGGAAWTESWPIAYEMHPAATEHGKGPKSTPALAGGTLYTLGITGVLSALDADSGRTIWRKEFAGQFPATAPQYGTATSPLVDHGLVIAYVGGFHDGSLTAFDAKTGEPRWSLKGEGPGYASPIVAELGGVRQIVTQSDQSIIGVDPATGKLLWKLPLVTPYDQNAVTPLVVGDLLIVSGIEYGLRAYRPEKGGDAKTAVLTPREVWNKPEVSLYMSSPVVAEGRLFGFSHRKSGHLFCLEPKTGRVVWTGAGHEGSNMALVSAGDVVLALNDASELFVLAAGAPGFAPVARYSVADSPTWAHPVPVSGGILIKDKTRLSLWSWEAKNTGPASSYNAHGTPRTTLSEAR